MKLNFFSKIEALAARIEKNPFLEMVSYSRSPGITKNQFLEVEEFLGTKLSPQIRDFFIASNGFRFQWRIKEDLEEKIKEKLIEKSINYDIEFSDDESNPLAHINILPIEDSILKMDWVEELKFSTDADEMICFNKKNFSAEHFFQHLKPFDLFSEYSSMAFFIEKGNSNPKVLWLTDHYINWRNSRITDFNSYLQFLLATIGMTEGREKCFEIFNGHELDPIIWNESFQLKEDLTPVILEISM